MIQPPLQTILFSDDLSIHLRSSNPNRALRILQAAQHKIHSWLSTRVFHILTLKTKFIICQKPRSEPITLPHPLVIANNNIPQVEEIKVVGLLFQHRHSWLPHIKSTTAKCMRALNILRILTHSSHGCNRKILLPLYTTLIRAILDYGSPIYRLTPSSQLKLLDPIQNSAIRLVTGAFRTSPAPSLCAGTGIPPLHYRRLTLTAKFLTSILQHPQTTTFNHIFHPPHNLHPDHNLQAHLQRQLDHSFRFRSLNPILSTVPPWLFSPLMVNLSLTHSLNILNPQRHLQATEDSFEKSLTLSKNQPYASPTAQKFITDLASHT